MAEDIRDRIAQKFTHAELQLLKGLRQRIADALPVCDDAEACGANVSGIRQALEMMDQKFTEIQARFMPSEASSHHDE